MMTIDMTLLIERKRERNGKTQRRARDWPVEERQTRA